MIHFFSVCACEQGKLWIWLKMLFSHLKFSGSLWYFVFLQMNLGILCFRIFFKFPFFCCCYWSSNMAQWHWVWVGWWVGCRVNCSELLLSFFDTACQEVWTSCDSGQRISELSPHFSATKVNSVLFIQQQNSSHSFLFQVKITAAFLESWYEQKHFFFFNQKRFFCYIKKNLWHFDYKCIIVTSLLPTQ